MIKNREAKSKKIRIAIVDPELCKPNKCMLECKKVCPPNIIGKECIKAEKTMKKAEISEFLCIGCGACQKMCPFDAIRIYNLPTNLKKGVTFQYGINSFKLYGIPIPKKGSILGIIGTNGTGKSTAIRIIAGELIPNFGDYEAVSSWKDIVKKYSGSELQNIFTMHANVKSTEKDIVAHKIQYVDNIREILQKIYSGKSTENMTVDQVLSSYECDERYKYYCTKLQLDQIRNRDIKALSGGELQRFAIALTCLKKASIYIFDEPSSFLDIKQRINAANVIRTTSSSENYVIVIEHDMCILDYVSDYGSIMYGESGGFGFVSLPYNINECINSFLHGKIEKENVLIRPHAIVFSTKYEATEEELESIGTTQIRYPGFVKAYKKGKAIQFEVKIEPGYIECSRITVLLGENGTGKTTFVTQICRAIKSPRGQEMNKGLIVTVSVKPQKILDISTQEDIVSNYLYNSIGDKLYDSEFSEDVVMPLNAKRLFKKRMSDLSGGERQIVSLVSALGKAANLYLIDEPSAYLDVEMRFAVSRVIKKYVMKHKVAAFIVEHDFMMAKYLADHIIVFGGTPGKSTTASTPLSMAAGMNKFLRSLDVTFRKDISSGRPRINKHMSVKDKEQKEQGSYFVGS